MKSLLKPLSNREGGLFEESQETCHKREQSQVYLSYAERGKVRQKSNLPFGQEEAKASGIGLSG